MFLPGARGFDTYLGIPYSDDMGEARATPCNRSGMTAPPGARHTEEEDVLAPYGEAGLAPEPTVDERGECAAPSPAALATAFR